MAWPDHIKNIRSNVSTIELWLIKQQMDMGDYKCDQQSGFAQYSKFDVLINGNRYTFSEFFEEIDSIWLRHEADVND